MFYDERIEFEKGRIAKNCIIIAVIGAFLFGAIQAIPHIFLSRPSLKAISNVLLSALIAIGGSACLIVGSLKTCGQRDERTDADAYAFYARAGMKLLLAALIAWAIILPYSMVHYTSQYNLYDIPFDYALVNLFSPICIYCLCSFKKHNIYFNYSILESEHYYIGVFKNIGKLSAWAGGLLLESFASYILFHTFENMQYPVNDGGIHMRMVLYSLLSIFIIIAFAYAALAVLYLILSALEKNSYENEDKYLSKATVTSLVCAFGLQALLTYLSAEAYAVPPSLADILQAYSYIIASVNMFLGIMTALAITYFAYEYTQARKNPLLSGSAYALALAAPAFSFLITFVTSGAPTFFASLIGFEDSSAMSEFYIYLSDIKTLISDASLLLQLALVSCIIFALIRDGVIEKVNCAAPAVFAVYFGIELFLRTQVDFGAQKLYSGICAVLLLIYVFIVTAMIREKDVPDKDQSD